METEEDPNPGSRQSVVEGLQVNLRLPVGPDPQPGSACDLPARQKNQTEHPVHQMWTKSMSVSRQKNQTEHPVYQMWTESTLVLCASGMTCRRPLGSWECGRTSTDNLGKTGRHSPGPQMARVCGDFAACS